MSTRSKIYLSNTPENISAIWQDGICFKKLIPPSKVSSVLEVCGNIKFAALSSHYEYMAILSRFEGCEMLFLIHLKKKSVEMLNSFPNPVSVIYFAPDDENILLIGSECELHCKNIESMKLVIMKGHNNPPTHVFHRKGSNILTSWNTSEVLIWSWPECTLAKRLSLDSKNDIVEAGHIWESHIIFAAFDTGVILIYDLQQNMKEYAIEPPDGICMEYRSFSLSLNGEWLIGIGSQSIIVIYSLSSLRVTQVVNFSHVDSVLGLYSVHFLPCILPQYPKAFLIQTTRSIILVDFVKSSVIKALNSHHYTISNVCVSGDGFLMSVTYGNGTSKLYTLPSFFPLPSKTLKASEGNGNEIKFSIMKMDKTEEKKKSKKNVTALFDETKWKEILEEFKEFPKSYRKHIWVSLMKLPRNYSIIQDILKKDERHKFLNLEKEFPDVDSSILEAMRSVLHCLCYWSPLLSQVEFLPCFLLPFIEVFDANVLLCFEASVFIISNWCRFWFERWPLRSKTIIDVVEKILNENDIEILDHLKQQNIEIDDFIWLILSSACRKILTYEEWLIAWDHILCKPPSFMLCICVSFVRCLRQTILKCTEKRHTLQLFQQETWIPIQKILLEANRLFNSHKFGNIKVQFDKKVFLHKNALLPFDIGPDNEHQLKMINLPLSSCAENKSTMQTFPTRKENSPIKEKILQAESFADINIDQLKMKENNCIQNIQKTRRKLISNKISY